MVGAKLIIHEPLLCKTLYADKQDNRESWKVQLMLNNGVEIATLSNITRSVHSKRSQRLLVEKYL